jgi:hypothetical protein
LKLLVETHQLVEELEHEDGIVLMTLVVMQLLAGLHEFVVDLSDLGRYEVEVLLSALGRTYSVLGLKVRQAVVSKVLAEVSLNQGNFFDQVCNFRFDI